MAITDGLRREKQRRINIDFSMSVFLLKTWETLLSQELEHAAGATAGRLQPPRVAPMY